MSYISGFKDVLEKAIIFYISEGISSHLTISVIGKFSAEYLFGNVFIKYEKLYKTVQI